jgi:hypothetical protein
MIGTFHQYDPATLDTTRSFFRFGMILSEPFDVNEYAGMQSSVLSTTESDVQMNILPGTWNETRLYVIANSCDGDTTVTLRINGADTAQTILILAGATGVFVDATPVANVLNDLVDWRIDTTGSTVGSITLTNLLSENLT